MTGMVFAILILASFLSAAAGGTVPALTDAILDGAAQAVTLTIALCGTMCLFSGVMRVLSATGALTRLARLLRPLLARLFPHAYQSGEGIEEICANLAANLLGMGNAATPFALAAMEKMQKAAPDPETASDEMVCLAVLNTAPISLLPATLLALRRASGSPQAAAVLLPVAAVSLAGTLFALLFCRLLRPLFPIKRRTR